MKKLLIILLTFVPILSIGQTETIKKAKELISDKKYESAYQLLDKSDPTNDNPEIVLLKEDIVLNYFITSIMHYIFALKDLEKNEDVMDYRGQNGEFNMYMFKVDSILSRLINIYPANCELYKGLARYYYDVYLKYGGQWFKDDNELLSLVETNYRKVIEGKCADYLAYYTLGFVNLVREKYKESIPYFIKSIEKNENNADAYYNLAYAYLVTSDLENALKNAQKALELYEDKEYKSDAARMIGQIYMETKDDEKAIKYYELANSIDTNNYYNIQPLLYLYVKTNNPKTEAMRKTFFNLAPENAGIYNDLLDIYIDNNKENDLISFFESRFSAFKDNEKVKGNLNFYLGRIYLDIDKKVAKEYLIKAEKNFEKVFDKNHPVFNVIKEGLDKCKE